MALFNFSDLVNGVAAFVRPGRKVFVNSSTGSDVTGAGTSTSPYATIARGFQDIRSGQNDTLILTGTFTEQVSMGSKSDYAVIGADAQINSDAAVNLPVSPTNYNRFNATLITVTASGHALSVGDHLFFENVTQAGDNLINGGCYRVQQVVNANQFRIAPLSVDAGAATEPFTTATGHYYKAQWQVGAANNIQLINLVFQGTLLANHLPSLAVVARLGGGSTFGANIRIIGCSFGTAMLGLTAPNVLSLSRAGLKWRVQSCTFQWQPGGVLTPQANVMGALYVTGAVDAVISQCDFSAAELGLGTWGGFAVSLGHTPDYGYLLNSNFFQEKTPFPPGAGIASGQRVRVAGPSSQNMHVAWNFYQGDDAGAAVTLDGAFSDNDPAAYANVDAIPAPSEHIHGRSLLLAGGVSGSIGQHISGLSTANCATAVQVSGISGQIVDLDGDVAGVSSQVSGISGQIVDLDGDVAAVSAQVFTLSGLVVGISGQIVDLDGDVAGVSSQVSGISGQIVGLGVQVSGVSADLVTLSGNISRMFDGNVRTRLYCATAAIVSGTGGAIRNVPEGAGSHMEVQTKTDQQSDYSAPTTRYVVFGYKALAVSGDAPTSATTSGAAPADGTFETVPYPEGI